MLGFASDEGVRRNEGRVGAAEGPRRIREACASLAWHGGKGFALLDAGEVSCGDGDLEKAQRQGAAATGMILRAGRVPCLLGGGHEVAFAGFLGSASHWHQAGGGNFGVLNIDPHLDLRPADPRASSGTPFTQAWEWCLGEGLPFHYLCVGVEELANTRKLFRRAEKAGCERVDGGGAPARAGRRGRRAVDRKSRWHPPHAGPGRLFARLCPRSQRPGPHRPGTRSRPFRHRPCPRQRETREHGHCRTQPPVRRRLADSPARGRTARATSFIASRPPTPREGVSSSLHSQVAPRSRPSPQGSGFQWQGPHIQHSSQKTSAPSAAQKPSADTHSSSLP